MSDRSVIEGHVRVGDGVLSVRRKGNSTWTVARILGLEEDGARGTVTYWLDRLIHAEHETVLKTVDADWRLRGAYVTEMTTETGRGVNDRAKDAAAAD